MVYPIVRHVKAKLGHGAELTKQAGGHGLDHPHPLARQRPPLAQGKNAFATPRHTVMVNARKLAARKLGWPAPALLPAVCPGRR
eukprot:scaffold276099_cov43-Prasinocladus_malaysianus.AAC.1